VNLFHASPYAISNNTITPAAVATNMAPTPQNRTAWFGIMYSTVSAPQNFTNQTNLPQVTTPEYWTCTNNTIDGDALESTSTGYGYWLYYVDNNRDNLGGDHFGQISGGTVSNVDVGIMLKNRDTDPATNFGTAAVGAHANVSGVAFSLRTGGTGIRLIDDATWTTSNPSPLVNKRTVQLGIGAGVSITDGATGLRIEHPVAGTSNYTAYASITGGNLNNLALSGQSGNYIELVNHPNALNGTAATFDGNTGAAATLAQNFDIEDKISHKTDNATRGLVRVKATNVYVTTNSGSIQRGVDAASSADTVNVKAGTYGELVAFDKPLTLLGPNESIPGNGSRDAEAILQFPSGAANGSVLLYAGSNLSGVTISGFDLRCQDATIPNYHYLVYTSKIDNLTIRNNRMYGSEVPLYVLTANNQSDYRTGLLIEGNYIDGGPNVNNSYNRGMYIQATAGTIQDNVVINTNTGIQYMPYSHTTSGTIQRNTISAGSVGLYHNYQNKGAAQVTWSQNEVTVAANDRAGLKALVDGAYTTEQLVFRGIEAATFGTEGTGAAPQVSFTNNKVDGTGAGSPNYTASIGFRNVTAAATGVATLFENSFVNVDSSLVNKSAVGVVANCNWHEMTSGNQIAAQVSGTVTFAPWLVSGTDDDGVTIGFQAASGTCTGTFPVPTLDTKQRISCFGGSNGAININIADGTAPFSYNWSGPSSYTNTADQDISNLSVAGTYNLTLTDANGTTATFSESITAPSAAVTASVSDTDITCNSAGDGSITVSSPAGGYGTYETSIDGTNWFSVSSGSPYTFSNLAPASYDVRVRDAEETNCVTDLDGAGDTEITEPAVLAASVAKTDVTCNAAGDGTITISNPTGGYGSYEYRINGGSWQSSGSFTALVPGAYGVQIRDSLQTACVIDLDSQTITQPAVLSATVAKTNVTCNAANDGTITVSSPSGGYGTYEYRLDMGTWQSSGSFTGLAPATYSVQIRDAAQPACIITLGSQIITQPSVLSATVNHTDITCNGVDDGTITVSSPAGGYGTYEYRLDGGSWQSSGSFTSLAPATYNVQIRDSLHTACVIDLDGAGNTEITEPDPLSATVDKTDVTCNGDGDGTITVSSPTGGYGTYQYRLDAGTWQSSGSFTSLTPGTYSVQIRDAANTACTVTLGDQIISQPDVLGVSAVAASATLSCNNDATTTITATPSGGTSPFTYAWSPSGGMAATSDPVSAGSYTVVVTDYNGCQATSTPVVISNPTHPGNGVWYVNDNSTTGDELTTAVGNNSNIGTASCPFATINYAIGQATAGDTIYVDAGTYTENVAVSKRVSILGAGSASDPTAGNTVVTAAASGTSTMVYSVGGTDATTRQILKNVRVTGASGGTGNNNSGILFSGGSMGYFTFDNVTATGNTGHGLVSNVSPATAALTDVVISGSSFSNNGATGLRTASHSVDGFSVTNSTFQNNAGLGLAFNTSDNTTAQISNVTLNGVTFSNNNSVADLYAFRMLGNMSLTNVDFQGSAGSGQFGLYLLGGYVNQASAPAIGTVTLNDVTFSGTYTSAALNFLGYSNLSGVSMTDVVSNISNPTADRGHMRLSGVAGTLNLGNTVFTQPVVNPPALYIRLGSNFGASGSQATVQVDATNASFNGKLGSAMTLAELFDTEDKIRHALDNTTDAPGFVRVKANNVYVTTNSGSVQRGVDAASAGNIVNINDGTYTTQAVTVNKKTRHYWPGRWDDHSKQRRYGIHLCRSRLRRFRRRSRVPAQCESKRFDQRLVRTGSGELPYAG